MKSLNKFVLGGALVLSMSGCGNDLEEKINSTENNFTKIYSSNGNERINQYSETNVVVDLEDDGEADILISSTGKRISLMRKGLDIKEYNYFGDKYSSDKETKIVAMAYQEEFNNLLNEDAGKINLERLYQNEEPMRENQRESKLNNSSGVYREKEKTIYVDIPGSKGGKIVDIDGDGQVDLGINTELKKGISARKEEFNIKSYQMNGREYTLSDTIKIFNPAIQYEMDKILIEGSEELKRAIEKSRGFIYTLDEESDSLKNRYSHIEIKGKDFSPTNKTLFAKYYRGDYLIDIDGDGKLDFKIGDGEIDSRREGFFIKNFIDGKKKFGIEKYSASAETRVISEWEVRNFEEYLDHPRIQSQWSFWKD